MQAHFKRARQEVNYMLILLTPGYILKNGLLKMVLYKQAKYDIMCAQ